eukprot:CAMPEP_0170972684 /NCGR_PEP_ID=MMETSP0735-20130129/46190_1 /TAXON_ID=186038 /ORGANISM="Fragilariopsis kerguelensis, Strain L26-C5" /LENGTH=64 /DNA_ID=CAMNT_0011393331 /DNA_START=318 /DNA_END=512 /DNA_ORIENTATION=+
MGIETYQHNKEVTTTAGDSNSSNINDEMNIGNGHTHPTPLIFTIAIVAMVALIVGAIVVIVLDG